MKLLVVGTGSIGARHAANAAALAETAVVDADGERARAVAAPLGIRSFASLAAALDWRPAAVVVATPHRTHLEVAGAAIEAGADVLIEKPLAATLDGVAPFLARARALGRKAFVVCNMRYHPAVTALRENLPRIGAVRFAQAHFGHYLPQMRPQADYRTLYAARRAAGGGVVLDAIHEIDYLAWLFGPVTRVTAEAARLSDLDLDVEDFASLLLTHAGGVRSSIQLDYLQRWKRRGCTIVGQDGTLAWTSEGKSPERCTVRLYEAAGESWTTLLDDDRLDANAPYRLLMQSFLAALRGERTGLLSAEDAAEDLSVALAALAAAASGRAQTPSSPG